MYQMFDSLVLLFLLFSEPVLPNTSIQSFLQYGSGQILTSYTADSHFLKDLLKKFNNNILDCNTKNLYVFKYFFGKSWYQANI